MTVVRATPYHKKKNCQIERTFGILKNILNAVIFENESTSWVSSLAEANQMYNSIPHSTTQVSPYEIVYGYPSRKGQRLMNKYSRDEIMDMVNQRWSEWSKVNHRSPTVKMEIGELVLLKRPPKSRNECGNKYGKLFTGPWEIKSIINDSTYEINSDGHTVRANISQLRKYYPRADRSFVARIDPSKIVSRSRSKSIENIENSEGENNEDDDQETDTSNNSNSDKSDVGTVPNSTKIEIDEYVDNLKSSVNEGYNYKDEINDMKTETKLEGDSLGEITQERIDKVNSMHMMNEKTSDVEENGEKEEEPDLFSSVDTDELFKSINETRKIIRANEKEMDELEIECNAAIEYQETEQPRPKPRIINQIRDSSTPIRSDQPTKEKKAVTWSPCLKEKTVEKECKKVTVGDNAGEADGTTSRSGRLRKKTEKLSLDPAKKSYEAPK